MHLVAVAAVGRRGAVVADRDRQEVEHQVRVGDVVVRTHEPAALEVVGGARALAEQPHQPDERPLPHRHPRLDRHRLQALVLDVDLEVVLQVPADGGQVVHGRDAEGAQVVGVAHARQLEQLRRVERAAAQHHLAGLDALEVAATAGGVLDAGGAGAVEQDPVGERPRHHGEVRPVHHRVQVGACRAEAATAVHVAVELREALLAVAVDVVGARVAGLHGRVEERVEQRVVGRAAFEHQRPVVPAVGRVGVGEAVLHPLEVRQAVGVVPRLHAGVGGPALVVERVAALEDHPVDRAATAEHLAAGVVHAAPVHVRLGLALVLPVVEAAADRERERGRHVDEDVPLVVGPAGLQHEDLGRRIGRQPVGEGRPGRAAADDDVVVALVRHAERRYCPR